MRRPGFLIVLLLLSTLGRAPAAARTAAASAADAGGPSGFVLPIMPPGHVLTAFRPPTTRYGRGHRGVDLAATLATPARAAGTGTVVFAGLLAGRGVVSIDHPMGIRTTYEPVIASVKAGQPVIAGMVIGTLAPGHASCAPAVCLHWGARLPDGSYIDPMGLINGLRVRLKPWDP